MSSLKKLLQKTFIDKEGRFVIAQSPNLPLILWFLLEVIVILLSKGKIRSVVQNIATASLFTWAYLEITKGVNYFRRILGLFVAVVIVCGYFIG